jgi:hypothetical protein
MEEAIFDGVVLAHACAGIIITEIVIHFVPLKPNNGTKVWKCKTCNKEMTTTGDVKLKHHVAQREGGGISLCSNPSPRMQKSVAEDLTTSS